MIYNYFIFFLFQTHSISSNISQFPSFSADPICVSLSISHYLWNAAGLLYRRLARFRGSVSTTRRHEAARESNTSNFNDGNGSVDGWWCGSPGCLGSKVRDYNIPGMPFRVHQFGTPVPSLRSSQPREDLLFASLCPSPSPPRPSPAASRIRRVRATRSRAILSRKDLLSAGIGKRFIFPALFSPPVRYSSLSHVCTRCSSGSASVSSWTTRTMEGEKKFFVR